MTAGLLVLAMALDAAFGEPRWLWARLPHPAVLMGRAVRWCDQRFNAGDQRRLYGVLSVGLLVLGAAVLGALLSGLGPVAEVLLTAILLAQKSLVEHVRAVADALRLSTHDGRVMVGRIVSRDTTSMDDSAVARAAIESAAENLSDGVIAPAFWALVAGLPGILIYKVVNTADSMIGYRSPRYAQFGWAAARLDDVLNVVPARLTALLIGLSHGLWRGWHSIRADARLHRSPNAGWPEAAMARALNVALAGPRVYDGVLQDLAYVHSRGRRQIGAADIDAAIAVMWRAWGLMLGICCVIVLL